MYCYEIVRWISGLGQLSVAAVVGWIAWRQFKTDRDRVRLQLFEKRFSVYQTLINVFRELTINDNVSNKVHDEFYMKEAEVSFLFGDDVLTYYEEVGRKFQKYSRIKGNAPDQEPEHSRWKSEFDELCDWLSSNAPWKKIDLFKKYMSFKQYTT
jgi:hypothetical protein